VVRGRERRASRSRAADFYYNHANFDRAADEMDERALRELRLEVKQRELAEDAEPPAS
jgi:hypothetical protein